jgi:hypothetical protein
MRPRSDHQSAQQMFCFPLSGETELWDGVSQDLQEQLLSNPEMLQAQPLTSPQASFTSNASPAPPGVQSLSHPPDLHENACVDNLRAAH